MIGMRFGFSTSVTSSANLTAFMNAMGQYDCDIARFATSNVNIPGQSTGSRPYLPDLVQDYLDTSSYSIVFDPDHTYPQGSINNPTAAMKLAILNRCKEVITRFQGYGKRFILEPLNEYTGDDHATLLNEIIAELRLFNYTGAILYNLLPANGPPNTNGPQYPLVLNDPANNIIGGWHNYFQNATSTTSQMDRTMRFVNAGIRSINTEIGAAYATTSTEYANYTVTNVGLITKYFQDCYDLGVDSKGDRKVVNCLWMNHNIENLR